MTPIARPGMKLVTKAPSRVVGIVEHKGNVIVATEQGVYILRGEELVPLQFAPSEEAG